MKIIRLSVLVSAVSLLVVMNTNAQDANEILKKMDDVLYSPLDMTGKTKIVITDKTGNEKTREANIVQKGNDKRIFRFTAPSSQAGIAFLSLPDDVMYLYMPAYGKERRISSSVKSQKFAGTDFSYDDMESKPYGEKYTPKLINTEEAFYVIELTPLSPKSSYSKLVVSIDKTNYYPKVVEYFDKGGNKTKESIYIFVTIGNYWNAQEIKMTDIKRSHSTKMIMSDVKYDQGLSDDEFTVRKLKQ